MATLNDFTTEVLQEEINSRLRDNEMKARAVEMGLSPDSIVRAHDESKYGLVNTVRYDDSEFSRRLRYIQGKCEDILPLITGPRWIHDSMGRWTNVAHLCVWIVAKFTMFEGGRLLLDRNRCPHLVYMLVQSGKTSVRNGIILILTTLRLHDMVIITTGRDDAARPMQIERLHERLGPINRIEICEPVDGDITESNAEDVFEDIKDLILEGSFPIVVSKDNHSTHRGVIELQRLLNQDDELNERQSNNGLGPVRVSLFSDEGDEAVLPQKLGGTGRNARLGRNRGNHETWTRMVEAASGAIVYLTATAMPLLCQPTDWIGFPRGCTAAFPKEGEGHVDNATIIEPGNRATVLEQWQIAPNSVREGEIQRRGSLAQIPNYIIEHYVHHVVCHVLRFRSGKQPGVMNGGSHTSIINPGLEKKNHTYVQRAVNLVKRRITVVLNEYNYRGWWPGRYRPSSDTEDSQPSRLEEDSAIIKKAIANVISKLIKSHSAQSKVLSWTKEDMKSLYIANNGVRAIVYNMNTRKNEKWVEHHQNRIAIAGQCAARGVSTAGLVGYSQPWSPRLTAHDTFDQRGRYQGPRGDVLHLLRVALVADMIEDMKSATASELRLRQRLLLMDRSDCDLRYKQIGYQTAPNHSPAGRSRLGNATRSEGASSRVSNTLRLDRIPISGSGADTSTMVESRSKLRLKRLMMHIGRTPDIVSKSGDHTWIGVDHSIIRDVLSCTDDPFSHDAALLCQSSKKPMNLTIYNGSRDAKNPQLRRIPVRRSFSEEMMDNSTRVARVKDLISGRSSNPGPNSRPRDIALDGLGGSLGNRNPGDPGHLVVYLVDLYHGDARKNDALKVTGESALCAVISLPTDLKPIAQMVNWQNTTVMEEE